MIPCEELFYSSLLYFRIYTCGEREGGEWRCGAGAPAVEGRGAASASAADSARGSGSARGSARLSSATTRGVADATAAGGWRLATYGASRSRLAGPAQYVYELSSGSL